MHSTGRKIQAAVLFAFVCATLVWSGAAHVSRGQGPAMSAGAPTQIHTWQGGKNAKYVGPEACAKCHQDEAKTQHATAMGRALEPVATSEILRGNPDLTFRSGPYTYTIKRSGEQSIYTVTDGKQTVSAPILYAFGQGKAGQTYLFQRNGTFQESRVSFYKKIKGLDWTIGYERVAPPTLEEAVGRTVSTDEARSCFGCHTTGGVSGNQLRLDRMMPGVSCEACHGPGAEHVAAMEAKDLKNKRIFNPGTMSPDELSQEFCGSCHRSAEAVSANSKMHNMNNVRFQPYRLFTSRGHDPFDERLSCTVCHNAHENPKHDEAFYDSKCFACHRSGESLKSEQLAKSEAADGRDAKPCPVATKSCGSCHMPKIELPGSHTQFTDHRIRIARDGEPFPN